MYKMIITDYAQIEPRLLYWHSGDHKTLDIIREGCDTYEAHARATMGYSDKLPLKEYDKLHGTDIRFRAKRRVLSFGYQVGAPKTVMKSLEDAEKFPHMRDRIVLTLEQAKKEISEYRRDNPLIVQYWALQQRWLEYSATQGDPTHEIELASGRSLIYFNPRKVKNEKSFKGYELVCDELQNDPATAKKLYGGKICENIQQATAWDITSDAVLAIEKSGCARVLWTVYDEVITLVPEKNYLDHLKEVEYLMCNSSPWAKGLPIGVSSTVTDHYLKED